MHKHAWNISTQKIDRHMCTCRINKAQTHREKTEKRPWIRRRWKRKTLFDDVPNLMSTDFRVDLNLKRIHTKMKKFGEKETHAQTCAESYENELDKTYRIDTIKVYILYVYVSNNTCRWALTTTTKNIDTQHTHTHINTRLWLCLYLICVFLACTIIPHQVWLSMVRHKAITMPNQYIGTTTAL